MTIAATKGMDLPERLLFYSRQDPSGCRLWIGALHDAGYGTLWWKGRTRRAHRLSWELANGRSAGRLFVCHRCDVRACINPEHLFLGTLQDNTADMVAKDRHVKGEHAGPSRLNDQQVLAIRADNRTQAAIAADFGIHQGTVSLIKLRKQWRHLP